MNNFEFMAMNNPIRAIVQDLIEARILRRYSNLTKDKLILEIGCGNGTGTKLIEKYFKPKEIYAVDLDPRMIKLAKNKNHDKKMRFEINDATKLKYKNDTFDAIFDFAIIHHIPNWRDCLKELKRVLKPKGELILEDLSIETFESTLGKILRKLLDHPYTTMYKRKEFFEYLEQLGFKIKVKKIYTQLSFSYFVVIAEK